MQKRYKMLIGCLLSNCVLLNAASDVVSGLIKGTANETLQVGKIAAGATGAAIAYGIVNDMVTVRVCPEYFTKGFHRNAIENRRLWGMMDENLARSLLDNNNKNKIALWWGVNATWWFGAGLSVPVIAAARLPISNWPQLAMEDLVKPLGVGVASMLATSLAAGIVGYITAKNNPSYAASIVEMSGAGHDIRRYPDLQQNDLMNRYVADTFAHHAGYAGGAIVGLGVVGYTLWKRYQLAQQAKQEKEEQKISSKLSHQLFTIEQN